VPLDFIVHPLTGNAAMLFLHSSFRRFEVNRPAPSEDAFAERATEVRFRIGK